MSIRPFRETDQDNVITLWKKVFPDAQPHNNPARDIRTKREVQPELFLVAVLEDQVVGTAMAGFDGHRGWVYYLGVAPEFQRQGIGTSLMKRVESRLIGLGCPKLNLQIRANNAEVQSFYESLEYNAEDRLSMGKKL
ncbi:MAG: GNAT family acetyltransferase [Chloroflexi bacterium]|nr:GNAT family acetyltransferase [Chloroflexota bacterium]